MKASVVVRTFDSERTIGRVLDAVSAQNFDDFELVVVDSGSTDGTLDVVRRYPHTFVDYSHTKFTYSGSLNAGCRAARGEYIVCLSSHCTPLTDGWLGALVAAMESNESLAGAWGPLFFDTRNLPTGKDGRVEVMDLNQFYRRPNYGLQNPNSIIRRALWEERPFSEDVRTTEDQDWAHHFLRLGYRTALVHGAPVFYGIQHSPYQYGKKMMQEFLVLNECYGFRPNISTVQLARQSARIAGATVLGRKAPRAGALAVSSLAGRWAVDRVLRYRDLSERTGGDRKVMARALLLGAGRRLKGSAKLVARRAAHPVASVSGPQDAARIVAMQGKTRFFLVGEMRSGTSWLQRTLNAHPEVYCGGEGSFFGLEQEVEGIPVISGPTPSLRNALERPDGLRVWHSLVWNGWAAEENLEEDLRNVARLTVDYFLAKGSMSSGKRVVGDKSPLHTDHVDEIHTLFPDAKVIHIHRDGRDVAVSLMHHFWRVTVDRGGIYDLTGEELEKRDAYLSDPEGFLAAGNGIFTEERLGQMAVQWSRRVSKAADDGSRLFGPGGFAQLSYDDLLARPEENLARLFGLLGVASDEATVRRCVEKNSFEKLANRPRGEEDAGSFFRKGVSGEWRGVFTARDREVYEDVAGDALREMGYPLD